MRELKKEHQELPNNEIFNKAQRVLKRYRRAGKLHMNRETLALRQSGVTSEHVRGSVACKFQQVLEEDMKPSYIGQRCSTILCPLE